MREIKFNPCNFKSFGKGKVTTIRLGQKHYEVGDEVLLVCDESCDVIKATIIKIEIFTFNNITQAHISNDGFASFSRLRAELSKCYGRQILLGDIITIATFASENGKLL